MLVRVHAAGVNGGELLGRASGVRLTTGLLARGFPKRTGVDFAGEIVEVGPASPSSRRVRFFSGNPEHGLFAELTRLTDPGAPYAGDFRGLP